MVQRRGAASYSMRDRIHVQNAKQNAVIIIIITLLTCQVCLAEGKPSTNRGHLIDN